MVMITTLPVKRITSGSTIRFLKDDPKRNISRGDTGVLYKLMTAEYRGHKAKVEGYQVRFEDATVSVNPNEVLAVTREAPSETQRRKETWGKLTNKETWGKVKRIAQREVEGFQKLLPPPPSARALPSVSLEDKASRDEFLEAWYNSDSGSYTNYYELYEADGRAMIEAYLSDHGLSGGGGASGRPPTDVERQREAW